MKRSSNSQVLSSEQDVVNAVERTSESSSNRDVFLIMKFGGLVANAPKYTPISFFELEKTPFITRSGIVYPPVNLNRYCRTGGKTNNSVKKRLLSLKLRDMYMADKISGTFGWVT